MAALKLPVAADKVKAQGPTGSHQDPEKSPAQPLGQRPYGVQTTPRRPNAHPRKHKRHGADTEPKGRSEGRPPAPPEIQELESLAGVSWGASPWRSTPPHTPGFLDPAGSEGRMARPPTSQRQRPACPGLVAGPRRNDKSPRAPHQASGCPPLGQSRCRRQHHDYCPTPPIPTKTARVFAIPSHAQVSCGRVDERKGLPAMTAIKPAEKRTLAAMGLGRFVAHLAQEYIVARPVNPKPFWLNNSMPSKIPTKPHSQLAMDRGKRRASRNRQPG